MTLTNPGFGCIACPFAPRDLVRGADRARGRTLSEPGPHRLPCRRAAMSDKSPRQTMTKKSGKSLKEKRAAKRAKAAGTSQTETLLHTKNR